MIQVISSWAAHETNTNNKTLCKDAHVEAIHKTATTQNGELQQE